MFDDLAGLALDARIDAVNALRVALHERSPMREEPVDCVLWVPADLVGGNDYNPNTVAPPEMELLRHSIAEDGYTQPIVTWRDMDQSAYEVVDGFHRHLVGGFAGVRERLHGRLPVTVIRSDRTGRNDRIAATIRHNRARGVHQVGAMSDIVLELTRRNWSAEKIGRELGMEPDEVLRLQQVSGLADMFAGEEFSEAWEAQ